MSLPQQDAPTSTVLLAEDESGLRELLRSAIASWGYNVLAAESGRRCLAIISNQAKKIDFVVLDIVLPDLNGVEIARALNKQRPRTKCLLVSGYAEPPLESFVHLSNTRFMGKPFSLHELRVVIEEMLFGDAQKI
jgi:two-component system, cell cycle sensor histidine kinase and response regulator CckA